MLSRPIRAIFSYCLQLHRKLLLPYSKPKSKNYGFEKVGKNKFKLPIAKERNLKAKANNKLDKKTHRYPPVVERWSDVAVRKFKINVGSKEHTSQSYTFHADECEINLQCKHPFLKPSKDVDTSAQGQHKSYKAEIKTNDFEKHPEISECTHKTDDIFSFAMDNKRNQLPMEHTSTFDEYKKKDGCELKSKDSKDKVKKSVRFNDNDLCTFAPTQESVEKLPTTQEYVDKELEVITNSKSGGDAEIETNTSITTQQTYESLPNYLAPRESERHLKELNEMSLTQPNLHKVNNENGQLEIEPYCEDEIIIDESSFSSVSDVSKHTPKNQEIAINVEAANDDASNREKQSMDDNIQNNNEKMRKESCEALQKEGLSKDHEDESFKGKQHFYQNNSNNLSQVSGSPSTTGNIQTQINSTINLENNIVKDISLEKTDNVNEYSDEEYIPLSPPNQTSVYINIEALIKSRLGGSNHANENRSDLKHLEMVNVKQLAGTQDSVLDDELNKTLDLSPGLSDRDYFSISSEADNEIQEENHDKVVVQSNFVTCIDKINLLSYENNASLTTTGHSPLAADREPSSSANISSNEIENLIPIHDQLNEINNHIQSVIRTETPLSYKPNPNTDFLQTNKSKPILDKSDGSIENNFNEAKTLTCLSQSEFTPSTNKPQQEDNNAPITNAPSKNNINSLIPASSDTLDIGLDEENKNQDVFHSNDFKIRRVLFSNSSHSSAESPNEIYQSINNNRIAQSLENIKAIKPFNDSTENNVENAKISSTLTNSLNVVSEYKIGKYSTLATGHCNNENIDYNCPESCLSQIPNTTTNYTNEHSSVLKISNINEGFNDEEELIHSLIEQQEKDINLHVNVFNNLLPTGPSPLSPNASTLLSTKGVDFESLQHHDSESMKPSIINSKIHETTQKCEQNIDLSLQRDPEAVKNNVPCTNSNVSDSNILESINSVKCIPQVKINISSLISKEEISIQSREQAEEEHQCAIEFSNDEHELVTDLESISCIAWSNKLRLEGPKNDVCENGNETDTMNINPILSRKYRDDGAQMNEMEARDIVHTSANRVSDEYHMENSFLSTGRINKLFISDNSQIENTNEHINKHILQERSVHFEKVAFSTTKIKKETKTGRHNIDTIHKSGIRYNENDLQTSQNKNRCKKKLGRLSSNTMVKKIPDCANIGSVRSEDGSFLNKSTEKQQQLLVKFVSFDQKLPISNFDRSSVVNDVTLENNHDIRAVVTHSFRDKMRIPGSSNVKKNNQRFAKANEFNIKVFSPSRQSEGIKTKILATSSTTLSGIPTKQSGLKAENHLRSKSATNIKIEGKENKALLNTSDNFSEKRTWHLTNAAKHLRCQKLTFNKQTVNVVGSLMGLTTDKIKTSSVCKTNKNKINKNVNTFTDRIQNKNGKGTEEQDRCTSNVYTFDDLFTKSQATNCSSDYVMGFPEEQTLVDEQLEFNTSKNENSSATSSIFCGNVESSSQDSFYEKYNRRVFNEDSPGSHTSNEDSDLITSNDSSPLINYYSINKCSEIGKKSESKYLKKKQKRKCTSSSSLSHLFDNEELLNKRLKINYNNNISPNGNLNYEYMMDQSQESESYLNNGEISYSDYNLESPSENGGNTQMKSDNMSDSASEPNGSTFQSEEPAEDAVLWPRVVLHRLSAQTMTDTVSSSFPSVREEHEDLFDD